MTSQYAIGIDLGTTNSVVAFTPLDVDSPEINLLDIKQWVAVGQTEMRTSLPSFLYLPLDNESSALASLDSGGGPGVVGELARQKAADAPGRVVAAAKSWLCHQRVNRQDAILPWQTPDPITKVSPVTASRRYLEHLVAQWNTVHPHAPFAEQLVVLTVPASFDPAARELTREAALAAGLPIDFVMLEEPQAAVYRYLAARGELWRKDLKRDDRLLVVDVGGGTTDLTLVSVAEINGNLELRRSAVGNHLLVGGDNMDLALAHYVAQKLQQQGHTLDPWQSVSLWHSCRMAKESLLSGLNIERQSISVLGRGSRLIGGSIATELTREEVTRHLIDGFLPIVEAQERPQPQWASGFQDIGLPYESDPAITRHLAAFLISQQDDTGVWPTHLLLNGGVFRSTSLRERLCEVIRRWSGDRELKLLSGPADLDHAVAQGAAYYGWSKRRGGVRIRGGTARSYYIGIEVAGLAIPGAARPLRALCVAPRGMEEGSEVNVPSGEVGLVIGQPARFRFFASSTRKDDAAGTLLGHWQPDELVETHPVEVTLATHVELKDPFVPVRFHSRVTELGIFELWCRSVRDEQQWKLDFNVRDDNGGSE